MLLKNNISCNNQDYEYKWYYEDLLNKKEFQRIIEYAKNHTWILLVMMNKYHPMKIAIENILNHIILC